MPNYRSLTGGYFASPADHSLPVSIRSNNPGAVNGAAWERGYPGYVTEITYDGRNNTTVFETPEQGVAVWWDLLRRYRAGGVTTLGGIINRYGGGQDYSSYVKFVAEQTGLRATQVIDLNDDKTLLPFAKAMFRYEAGVVPPWSDAQILFGFKLGRVGGVLADAKPSAPHRMGWLAAVLRLIAGAFHRKPPAEVEPKSAMPWYDTMVAITGTLEEPGSADNPVIIGWRDEIARRFPDMAVYCANYTHDAIPWCGLTVAYCMAANGIRPVFGAGDLQRFLWADAWKDFGKRLAVPRKGCIMVFTRNGGGHVALYEGESDGDYYIIRGGNQSDAVTVTRMAKNKLTAAVWPE